MNKETFVSVEKTSFEDLFRKELQFIEDHLPHYFANTSELSSEGLRQLNKSINYSLLSGGKRFRPVLSLLTAEALGSSPDRVLPLAAAVEFIHTYSLIHDDLPAMDNDSLRRGKPTNHVVFGEATALLAGDALLTEAFCVLAKGYRERPQVGLKVIEMLADATGLFGMVGGQALDMQPLMEKRSEELMRKIHELKTGALIAVSCEAAAHVCEAGSEEILALKEYSRNLGLAFQLADDIMDFNPNHPEKTSYINVVGIHETHVYFKKVTELASAALGVFGSKAGGLQRLVKFNLDRVGLANS